MSKTKLFNTRLFNAARNYLIEVCRNEDKYALIDYQEHLFEMYSPAIVELIMDEVIGTLFEKYPNHYEWLNSLTIDEDDTVMTPMLTADDLYYLLLSHQPKDKLTANPTFSNFKFHPQDPDKLLLTSKAYQTLKELLVDTYSNDGKNQVEVDIDEIVEVSESV
jgi:hypothetical protein